MKIGFSTLSLFAKSNEEIAKIAKEHGFEMMEILAEGPYYENLVTSNDLELCIHGPTVDLNLASINRGIRAESIAQHKETIKFAQKIDANTITVHPGKIGRKDERLRKYAIELAIESIGELVDSSDVKISVENMPSNESFLANKVSELERIQEETGCMLTIDVGHGNTCNNTEEMLELKNISYCHLNDNNGVKDQHISLGEGTLDLNLLKKIDKGIIELNNFDNVLKSFEVIKNLCQ